MSKNRVQLVVTAAIPDIDSYLYSFSNKQVSRKKIIDSSLFTQNDKISDHFITLIQVEISLGTKLKKPLDPMIEIKGCLSWCWKQDSNLRRPKPRDLQSLVIATRRFQQSPYHSLMNNTHSLYQRLRFLARFGRIRLLSRVSSVGRAAAL